MKIRDKVRDVKLHVLKAPLAEPFAFSQGWVRQRSATLIEIVTDSGLVGWGEAFAQGLEPPEIAAKTVEVALKPLLIGADPTAVEVLWHTMYHATRDYGRKGSVIAAISGVDLALWDIAGKTLNVPVHQLLGGAFRSRVQPYATGFYRIKGQGEAARLADEALRHHEAGFSLMKVKLGYGVEDDIACMQAIRRALDGRAVRLMIDTNHAYGRAEAAALGRALDDYGLLWYEEPVAPEDLDSYVELRRKLSMPIAGGENEHTLYGFRDFIGRGCVDICQPDLGSCGGFTACRHVVALAQAHGVMVNPHVWGSAVAQAASLQMIAAIPTTNHSLYATQPILEYDRSSHPFRRDLVAKPIDHADGWVAIPTGPGLGIEIDRAVLDRYRVN
ncbi:MAG: mandelate racemase/muconate lactonizing enzyme family protein [Lautropia sp.]